MKNLFFAALTCYTCAEGASSNAKCNSQAIDIPCHLGLQVCKNELLVDDKGMTLLVTKQCVDKKSCIKGCVRLQNDSMVRNFKKNQNVTQETLNFHAKIVKIIIIFWCIFRHVRIVVPLPIVIVIWELQHKLKMQFKMQQYLFASRLQRRLK